MLHSLTLTRCSLIRVLHAYFAQTYLVSVTVLFRHHFATQPSTTQRIAVVSDSSKVSLTSSKLTLSCEKHFHVHGSTRWWCHEIVLSLFTDINSMNRKSYTTCNKSDGCLWLITQTLSECGADEVDCRLFTFASLHVLQLERCWWSEMCWRYEVRLTPTTGIGVPDISSGDKEKIRQYLNSHAKWTLTGMTHPPSSHNSIM